MLGLVTFNLDDVHPHDVATVLDMNGIAVRAGHHCAQPLDEMVTMCLQQHVQASICTIQKKILIVLVAGLRTAKEYFNDVF